MRSRIGGAMLKFSNLFGGKLVVKYFANLLKNRALLFRRELAELFNKFGRAH